MEVIHTWKLFIRLALVGQSDTFFCSELDGKIHQPPLKQRHYVNCLWTTRKDIFSTLRITSEQICEYGTRGEHCLVYLLLESNDSFSRISKMNSYSWTPTKCFFVLKALFFKMFGDWWMQSFQYCFVMHVGKRRQRIPHQNPWRTWMGHKDCQLKTKQTNRVKQTKPTTLPSALDIAL